MTLVSMVLIDPKVSVCLQLALYIFVKSSVVSFFSSPPIAFSSIKAIIHFFCPMGGPFTFMISVHKNLSSEC